MYDIPLCLGSGTPPDNFMKVYMISNLKMVQKKIQKRFPYDGEPILNLILMVLTL